jgi:hypothetical protein
VPSAALRDGWWAINDSGHTAELHALDRRGRLVASVPVAGSSNGDWEDLARVGPELYIADIGDNNHERDDLVVYRVREPVIAARTTRKAVAFPFRYPDGRHDGEGIVVNPANGTIYVLTKGDETRVYRFPRPLEPGRPVVLQRIRAAEVVARLIQVTGAAASPDGTRIAIRTYSEAYELRRRKGRSFESAFTGAVEYVPLPIERQGESITYTLGGAALVTTSEQPPAPIWRLARR